LLQQGCTQVLRKNGATITKCVWAVLTRPPYSPDLSPSYFNLFGALKGAILGIKFETEERVICVVRNWLREQDKAWYREGTYTLVPSWCKAVRETLWKNGTWTETITRRIV
jgi:transposase